MSYVLQALPSSVANKSYTRPLLIRPAFMCTSAQAKVYKAVPVRELADVTYYTSPRDAFFAWNHPDNRGKWAHQIFDVRVRPASATLEMQPELQHSSCDMCGWGYTQEEYDDRHSDGDYDEEYHSYCCPKCKNE